MSKVRTKLSEQLWAEAIRLGKDRFQARACIPCQDTDTDRLLTRAADTIDTLTVERDELREIVGKCRDHLDGCSHGYSNELWDSVNEADERAERGDCE